MSYVAVRILSASLSVRSWMDGRHIEGYCKLFHLLHLCRLIFFWKLPHHGCIIQLLLFDSSFLAYVACCFLGSIFYLFV